MGIETLDNIIREMYSRGLFVEANYTMQTFNQRFLDDCAGVFCNVTISVPTTSLCSESFADFLKSDFKDNVIIF